jgi:hypothetical protein
VEHALHWVRRRQRALAKLVLALFCLAWLQTAAVPCAMAAAGSVATGQHCPYCPAGAGSHAANAHRATCAYPHQPQADARDAGALFLAAPVQGGLSPVQPAPVAAWVERTATDAAVPIPISVRYCRYLE